MSDWYVHTMGQRREALEQAARMLAAGVERVDFVYAWYNDEDQFLTAKAFDAAGQPLPDDRGLADWTWLVARTVPGWPTEAMLSYSPRHHQVLKVGEFEWPTHFEGHPLDDHLLTPVAPVPDAAYDDLVAILTWRTGSSDDQLATWVDDARPAIRAAVAANPAIPAALQERLASDPSDDVRRALARNPGLADAVARRLAADKSVLDELSENRQTPPDVLVQLAGDPIPEPHREDDIRRLRARRRALENHAFPIAALEAQWQQDENSREVGVPLASHPHVSPATFAALCQHRDRSIRDAAFRNRFAKPPLASVLSLVEVDRDASPLLVGYDFASGNGPRELRELLSDPDALVARRLHGWLAQNETVPPASLARIPRDSWSNFCLSKNVNSPAELRAALAADPAFESGYRAEADRLAIDRLTERSAEERARQLAEWARSPAWPHRRRAAQSPDTSEALLIELLGIDGLLDTDGSEEVRWGRQAVRAALAIHRNLPVSVLAARGNEEMLRAAATGRTRAADLRELAAHESWRVRLDVARNTNTPADVLERLAADQHEWVREGVRFNIAAPRHLLQRR